MKIDSTELIEDLKKQRFGGKSIVTRACDTAMNAAIEIVKIHERIAENKEKLMEAKK